ncbi:uncharacterized protein BDR25DRAFT_301249 [Lindgomyces ingoldianus]|uniref:Uncharacterized protein n=1 Tax=Lindgomyces ingoldianus TaxID=673940 RepID=A0ACB6R5J0_9PLEO|nr:uncharacterized protein BDR25DRAFT_301249 [Lindgomyces ingoldianus]KAF2474543.1 hypothetical protein BDR25DRAFT_301249 [Lindgomyces ingoldianus]
MSASTAITYTKNYYHVLSLPSPTWRSSTTTPSSVQIRVAYKRALFLAHPDNSRLKKQQRQRQNGDRGGREVDICTVDDVKEAYAVLGDGREKERYDKWLAERYEDGVRRYGDGEKGLEEVFGRTSVGVIAGMAGGCETREDFVLGLEVLDLADFEAGEGDAVASTSTSTQTSTPSTSESGISALNPSNTSETETLATTQYTRSCRCGAEPGFRFSEIELEDALSQGEKEILVGCEGCSLWVRVGFDVVEEAEEERG